MNPEVTQRYRDAVRILLHRHGDWIMATDAVALLGPDRINTPHFRQVAQRVVAAGEAERMQDGPLRVFYRWCGPDLSSLEQPVLPSREKPEKPANVTPPRRYGNAAMPTADAEFWKKHNNWGRT